MICIQQTTVYTPHRRHRWDFIWKGHFSIWPKKRRTIPPELSNARNLVCILAETGVFDPRWQNWQPDPSWEPAKLLPNLHLL
jgi:hypothetical protein